MTLAFLNDLLGTPDVASEHGAQVKNMAEVVHWVMALLGVGWGIFVFYALWRFSAKRNPKAIYSGVTSHFSTHVEVGVIVVEVVLLLGFAFPLWAARVDRIPVDRGNAVKVRAVAEQFRWTFHYAGPDNSVGLTKMRSITSANPIGLVEQDPNATDDFVSVNELVLPKGRTCVVQVTSKDVIHGLALIPMWIQADAIPGKEIPLWFVPTKTGEWDIVCAQLCGQSHARMVSKLKVMEGKDFDKWYAGQNPLLPKKP